jgi:hypothetical protein
MSWAELKGWIEYDEIDPFGEHRADLRNAMSMAQRQNIAQMGKGRKAKAKDFMPFIIKPKFESELDAQLYEAFMELGAQRKD